MAKKCNLYELQKKIPYKTVAPILTAWDEQSDNDVTDLARMAYDAGRNSISKEKNKMEQVAKLFGKKLNEEFDIKWGVCEYTIRFTKDGMEVTDDYGEWYEAQLYRVLLTGEAVIVDDK